MKPSIMSRLKRLVRATATVSCLLLPAGCTEEGGGGTLEPPAYVAVVSVDSPHEDDRALLIRISGTDGLSMPIPEQSEVTVHARARPGELWLAVFGRIQDGRLLHLDLPVDDVSQYSIRVEEAAGPGGVLRDTAAYVIQLTLQEVR